LRASVLAILLGLAGCGSGSRGFVARRSIEITATDYAFQIPGHIGAEQAFISFTNQGKVEHELNISLLKKGVRVEQMVDAIRNNQTVQPFIDGPVGVLFASPGKKSIGKLGVGLLDGRDYAVICINRDSAKAPMHIENGMYSVIHVAGPPLFVQGQGQSHGDAIVATDYAFTYPRTVAPHHYSFAFQNNGKVRHELNMALLKSGATLQQVLAIEKAGGNSDSLFEAGVGVLQAQPGKAPLGRLEVDMLPGREYMIVCFFANDDKSPPHFKLGMYGSIRVTGQPQA
jgi:hypothetical protein